LIENAFPGTDPKYMDVNDAFSVSSITVNVSRNFSRQFGKLSAPLTAKGRGREGIVDRQGQTRIRS